jgi:hypothetical protein
LLSGQVAGEEGQKKLVQPVLLRRVLGPMLVEQQQGECKGVAHGCSFLLIARQAQAWRKGALAYVRWRTLSRMYGGAQTCSHGVAITRRMRKAISARGADLVVVVCIAPAKSCAQSRVMLARVRPRGIFEVLTAAAWAEALGYPPEELNGTSLRDLMRLEKPAATDIVAALLDEEVQPLEVSLRCKGERRKRFSLHRRFDTYEEAVFLVADELAEERVEPCTAYA